MWRGCDSSGYKRTSIYIMATYMIMCSLLLFPIPRSCAFSHWSLVLPALQGSPCCIVFSSNCRVICLLHSFCHLPVLALAFVVSALLLTSTIIFLMFTLTCFRVHFFALHSSSLFPFLKRKKKECA
jgi:hypothetical protein